MEFSKEPNFQLLSARDFTPEKYVKNLSQSYVGGSELQNLRRKLQSLSEETSNNLKKNVYENYVQFIETAKEISHLESEMYQLSHLLSEQKSLLSALSTTSILEDTQHLNIERENKSNDKDIEEENKQKLAAILEKVEGCKELLEVPGRKFLYEGDLLEIDPTENTSLKTVHVYLFTDGFMITNRNSNSRGLMKYIYEIMYDLSSLAVVNVRDLGNVKHAFKLLIFPDTRVFQCSSNSNKHVELALKIFHTYLLTPCILCITCSHKSSYLIANMVIAFDEVEDDVGTVQPEWFLDIPEELDVCVAQRHFEEALSLLQKAKEYISQMTAGNEKHDHVFLDIQRKVEQRQNSLTEVLMKELEVNPDKSLQGGLRAARRAVRLLNQLGRENQSCNLFLKLCSSMLRTQCKRVKREGSTTTYIRNLASVVFTNMCHMSDEFLRAFPDSPTCASAYVVWASNELLLFTGHFIKQVFMPQTSLSTVTECIVLVRTQCERLYSYGLDLCYQLDGALRSSLVKALKDARDKLIDSIKLRALEDKWIPINLHSKSALGRFLHEHSQMGLNLESYVSGGVNSKDRFTPNNQRSFLTKNAEFLLVNVVEVSQKIYSQNVGYECATLKKLQGEYVALKKGVSPTTRSTKTKYSSEFL
uniref:Exocyst complex component 8-like n=1 Tax=Diabrotica virgifera virgifera TaxID=50390 RepID=A0A6P7GEP0_DIAVI